LSASLDPVVRAQTAGGPAWLVTDRELVRSVLVDPRFGIAPPGTPGLGSLFTDGEPHARLRRLPLARIEIAEALRALATQLPDLRLGCEPQEVAWVGSPLDDGPIALPVFWV
jgi:cytochrome P450